MNFGVCVPLVAPYATAHFIETLGCVAEERGFASIWVGEHVVLFDEYESKYPLSEDGRMPGDPAENVELEPFSSLAFLAAHTSKIRLGTGVCVLPQRNPVYTAKEAANVDWLSGGRLNLGIGLGWLAEEYEAVATPFEKRGSRCDSYVEVIKRLWCDEVSAYRDGFYELPACRFYPKPVQMPHPPLFFGGSTDGTLGRVARLGQGWYGLGLTPSAVERRIARLEELLHERGRDRAEVSLVVAPYPEPCNRATVEQYRDAGIDELVFMEFPTTTDELKRVLGTLADEYVTIFAA